MIVTAVPLRLLLREAQGTKTVSNDVVTRYVSHERNGVECLDRCVGEGVMPVQETAGFDSRDATVLHPAIVFSVRWRPFPARFIKRRRRNALTSEQPHPLEFLGDWSRYFVPGPSSLFRPSRRARTNTEWQRRVGKKL